MPDRIIRERECLQLTGLSRTTRWRLERHGQFPRRRHISPNGVGWLLSEIEAWQSSRSSAQGREAA
jgi:prophage regulatory protein